MPLDPGAGASDGFRGVNSPTIARWMERQIASSQRGYAANRGGMIIVCSASASSSHRRASSASADASREHAPARSRGTGSRRAAPRRAAHRTTSGIAAARRHLRRFRAVAEIANEWQPAYGSADPAGPAGKRGQADAIGTRHTSTGCDTGDSCRASRTPSPRRRPGTTRKSRRSASPAARAASRGDWCSSAISRRGQPRPAANRTPAAARRRTDRRRRRPAARRTCRTGRSPGPGTEIRTSAAAASRRSPLPPARPTSPAAVSMQIAAVVQQPDVEIARHLQQPAVDARQFRGPRQQIRESSNWHRVERRQPLRLRRRVLGVRRQQIEVRGSPDSNASPDERVQLGMRQTDATTSTAIPGLAFELRGSRRTAGRTSARRPAPTRNRSSVHGTVFLLRMRIADTVPYPPPAVDDQRRSGHERRLRRWRGTARPRRFPPGVPMRPIACVADISRYARLGIRILAQPRRHPRRLDAARTDAVDRGRRRSRGRAPCSSSGRRRRTSSWHTPDDRGCRRVRRPTPC